MRADFKTAGTSGAEGSGSALRPELSEYEASRDASVHGDDKVRVGLGLRLRATPYPKPNPNPNPNPNPSPSPNPNPN